MRFALLPAALALLSVAAEAAPQNPDPTGTWLTGDGRAKIRFDRCGPGNANLCGRVVWLRSPAGPDGQPRTDARNPDPAKRGRPVLGLRIMDNLAPDGARFSGDLYNAEEGKVYQVSVAREGADELSVSGCLLRILCGSQTWNRVPDVGQRAGLGGD